MADRLQCDRIIVLGLGERVDDPVAEVLLGAPGLRFRHLAGLDALQLALGVLHRNGGPRVVHQVTQAREQRWKAGIVVRRRGDGFPWRSAAHAAGKSLVGTAQSAGTARERCREDRTEEPPPQKGISGFFRDFPIYS